MKVLSGYFALLFPIVHMILKTVFLGELLASPGQVDFRTAAFFLVEVKTGTQAEFHFLKDDSLALFLLGNFVA